ncbi:MAG: mannose-1-phosphate guanylyltransferase/mannose-6-phosphate isomerase [Proteobacteria bacterium]|jgi:mannose-1-phosphate guanylyltransferase/mannose-6-phosphate isomerase|nr:mannose-1-phosphate guanylyltransferase/mannose-6-phosphate isomerase [Candidatus Fonsibacter sp. PEL5]NKA16315.1 mannose-1-phosphate guanylyltransferase/mannose-6-phosphate isomerase [Candidatus Fonsibacter sp. PEL55]
MKIKPIILCGGEGTRLWPESRKKHPKQFIKINGKSLLKHAIDRVSGINFDPISICSNSNFLDQIKEETKNINCKIFVEPDKKNTAAAILAAINDDDLAFYQPILIISSDHIIQKKIVFQRQIKKLSLHLDMYKIFIFGVKPDYPETGYGYLYSKKINKNFNKVIKFIEKPNLSRAKKLIKNNNYLWNSGMFLSNKSALLNEFSVLQTKLALQVCDSYINAKFTKNIVELENKYYSKIKSISFDHAILEKSNNVFSTKLLSDWKDVGSWIQKWEIEKKDKDNNYIKGNIFKNKVKNSYISSSRTIVASNLKNILAVDNNDVLFLSDLKNNDLKNIYPIIHKKFPKLTDQHTTTQRPWGQFTNIFVGKNFQVKELVVKPGAILSLQKHKYRSENWVVVEGKANVTLNKKKIILHKSDSIFIPQGAIHRIENRQKSILKIIEVQTGTYLGEDDIIRIKDVYGRV